MAWKIVERSCIIMGTLFTAVCAYYAVATYYAWNQPQAVPSTLAPVGLTPPLWLYAAGTIGIALIATGWRMMHQRRTVLAAVGTQIQALPEKASNTRPAPSVAQWLTPLKAIEEFADQTLVRAALEALNKARSLQAEKDEYFKKSKGAYETLKADLDLGYSDRAQKSEIAFLMARNLVLDNLISQMKHGDLVARALPFSDKKLIDDQDWEIIKASHWSALTFDTNDTKLETVSGGGRTYIGLQIGKPR